MSKPEWCPQDVWDETGKVLDGYLYSPMSADEAIARAILAERERCSDQVRDLADCLDDMTKHYVELVGSGDCGGWDASQEAEVIAARKMIATIRGNQ